MQDISSLKLGNRQSKHELNFEIEGQSEGEVYEAEAFEREGSRPLRGPMLSPLAVYSGTLRQGLKRTLPVFGLCVHTTGSGPALRAKERRQTPLQIALDFYLRGREGFPHYLINHEGTIHAVCDEQQLAWHAGWKRIGGKKRWEVWSAPTWWRNVWRRWNVASPAGLLPSGANDPNQVYIGVEMLANESGYGFTSPQYRALAQLILDVSRRHNFTIPAAPSPRLLGHEDVDPISRSQSSGGWDPGAHRANPKFSWVAVWSPVQAGGGPIAPERGPSRASIPPAATASSFSDLVRRALGGPLPRAAVRGLAEVAGAFSRGERNPSRLTDIIFYARHPDRDRRPIGVDEAQLAREWLWIRDSVITPALRHITPAGQTSSTVPDLATASPIAAQFTARIPERLRFALLAPLLDRNRGDVPLDFLLGWIAVESDGRIDVVTGLNERGFFQIHPDESKNPKLKFQHERLTADPSYSASAGIQLVRYYADLVRQRFPWIPGGSELFWRVVKLEHAMGSPLARTMLEDMRKRGVPPTSWEAIKRYEVTHGPRLHPLLRKEPGRFGRNVDQVFVRGKQIAKVIGR